MKGWQESTPSTGGNIRRILDVLCLYLFSKKMYFDWRVFGFSNSLLKRPEEYTELR